MLRGGRDAGGIRETAAGGGVTTANEEPETATKEVPVSALSSGLQQQWTVERARQDTHR